MRAMPPRKRANGLNGWRRVQECRNTGDFTPETYTVCDWDKLLIELHLTEEQALMAVVCGDVSGHKLRLFALRFCQHRYIPEDVLSFLQLTKSSGEGALAIQSSFETDG